MLPPLSARIGLLSCGWAVVFLTLLSQSISARAVEFSVGGPQIGEQNFPSAIVDALGGCVVWEDSKIDGSGRGIAASRLDSSFTPTGTVFKVNQLTAGNQQRPQAVSLGEGKVLFAWETAAGQKSGIYARVLNADGSLSARDELISRSTWTTTEKRSTVLSGYVRNKWKTRKFKFREKLIHFRENPGNIVLAGLADGGALVVYQAACRTETNTYGLLHHERWVGFKGITNDYFRPFRHYGDRMNDIFLQRVDASGKKVGSEIAVNQYASFNQRSPALATLSDGSFIIVWVSETPRTPGFQDNFRVEIFGRRFSAQGEPLGDEFTLTSEDNLVHSNPAVASLPDGGFTLFWSQREVAGRWDVHGRTYDTNGLASSASFRVNSYLTGDQFAPKASASGAHQMVVWTSVGQDGSREGVYGRMLDSSGPVGNEIRISTTSVSRQIHPAIASDELGRFLCVWASYVGETGFDVFGNIFFSGASPSASVTP